MGGSKSFRCRRHFSRVLGVQVWPHPGQARPQHGGLCPSPARVAEHCQTHLCWRECRSKCASPARISHIKTGAQALVLDGRQTGEFWLRHALDRRSFTPLVKDWRSRPAPTKSMTLRRRCPEQGTRTCRRCIFQRSQGISDLGSGNDKEGVAAGGAGVSKPHPQKAAMIASF